ncbi:MAG: hypothetical protein R2792_14615 [Saprospiraceae bacterium]
MHGAADLSRNHDVAFYLPSTVPNFGDHISLFTLIWVVTTSGTPGIP